MYLCHQERDHLLHHLLDQIVDLGVVLSLRGNTRQQLMAQRTLEDGPNGNRDTADRTPH